jgi:hypothetical protein
MIDEGVHVQCTIIGKNWMKHVICVCVVNSSGRCWDMHMNIKLKTVDVVFLNDVRCYRKIGLEHLMSSSLAKLEFVAMSCMLRVCSDLLDYHPFVIRNYLELRISKRVVYVY